MIEQLLIIRHEEVAVCCGATTKETRRLRPKNKAWPEVRDVVMKSVYIRDMQISRHKQRWQRSKSYSIAPLHRQRH